MESTSYLGEIAILDESDLVSLVWITRMANLNELRQRFESKPRCRIVSPDVFVKMMVSHSTFVRADEPNANFLGLIDEQTGNRIFVKGEEMERIRDVSLQLN